MLGESHRNSGSVLPTTAGVPSTDSSVSINSEHPLTDQLMQANDQDMFTFSSHAQDYRGDQHSGSRPQSGN